MGTGSKVGLIVCGAIAAIADVAAVAPSDAERSIEGMLWFMRVEGALRGSLGMLRPMPPAAPLLPLVPAPAPVPVPAATAATAACCCAIEGTSIALLVDSLLPIVALGRPLLSPGGKGGMPGMATAAPDARDPRGFAGLPGPNVPLPRGDMVSPDRLAAPLSRAGF